MLSLISILAEYFICWWLALFIVLPIGLRTQDEENDVVEGTIGSAPAKFKPLRVFLTTSIVAAIIYAIWFVATRDLGLNAFTIPRIVPKFY